MAGRLLSLPGYLFVLLLAMNPVGPTTLGAQVAETTGGPFTINGSVTDAVSGESLQYAAVGIPEWESGCCPRLTGLSP